MIRQQHCPPPPYQHAERETVFPYSQPAGLPCRNHSGIFPGSPFAPHVNTVIPTQDLDPIAEARARRGPLWHNFSILYTGEGLALMTVENQTRYEQWGLAFLIGNPSATGRTARRPLDFPRVTAGLSPPSYRPRGGSVTRLQPCKRLSSPQTRRLYASFATPSSQIHQRSANLRFSSVESIPHTPPARVSLQGTLR